MRIRQKNQSQQHVKSSHKKLFLWVLLGVILIGGGAGTVAYRHHSHQKEAIKHPTATTTAAVQTHKAQSEGKTFTVPNSVPQDSITNYSLLTENDQYKIRYDGPTKTYTVTLYAIVNSPREYDSYLDQLRQYKQSALEYMKNKGIDVTKVKIVYDPDEATKL